MWFGIDKPPDRPMSVAAGSSRIPPVASRPGSSMSIGDDSRLQTANVTKKNRVLQGQIKKMRNEISNMKEVMLNT